VTFDGVRIQGIGMSTGPLEKGVRRLSLRECGTAPDFTRIYSGGPDGMVRVWDTTTGKQLMSLRLDLMKISKVLYSRSSNSLLAIAIAKDTKTALVQRWTAEDWRPNPDR
jgi:WD40 repeat protein